jgi:hypothetical protein
MTTATVGIADEQAALEQEIAATQTALDDATLAAKSDPAAKARVAQLKRELASLNEQREDLLATARAALRQRNADRDTANASQIRAAVETVTSSVGAFQVLATEIQQDAGRLAEKVGRMRAAEYAAHRAAHGVVDAHTRDSLGSRPDLLLDAELAALLAAVATGRLGDIDIVRAPGGRARRLLETVRRSVKVDAAGAAAVT